MFVVLVCMYPAVHCSALDWVAAQFQESSIDGASGRIFQVQNVSQVITYTGLVVAVVMMSSFLWLAVTFGDTHYYRNYRSRRSLVNNHRLDEITSLLGTAVKVYEEEEDGDDTAPSLERILSNPSLSRQERMEDLNCQEFEEFCNLGDKVRINNMEIGEALPLVYSALGRSGNLDFRSSLTTFLSGLQGRSCDEKPAQCK